MKKVRINVGKVGVVSKKGDYEKVLTAGAYWLKGSRKVITYDMQSIFLVNDDFRLKMQHEDFASMITELIVKDGEMVLKYRNGSFESILTAGHYFYWKGLADFTFKRVNLNKIEITEDVEKAVLAKTEVARFLRVFQVESHEKGLLFVDGEFVKILNAGVYKYWLNSQVVRVLKADMRQLIQEVSGQEILTKDKAALRMNFNTKYRIVEVEKAMVDSKDFEKQLYVLTQLALREYVGGLSLDELLENKDAVSTYVMNTLEAKAKSLGIKIQDCGIRDIILPGEMKDIMNQVLIAQKQAQANVITRREETASTRSLLNTAKLMEDNQMLYKLKEMEYVERIADKIGEITLSGNGQMIDQLKQIFTK